MPWSFALITARIGCPKRDSLAHQSGKRSLIAMGDDGKSACGLLSGLIYISRARLPTRATPLFHLFHRPMGRHKRAAPPWHG